MIAPSTLSLRRSNSLSRPKGEKAEQSDEDGVDGRELPGVGEILDPLTPPLLGEEVLDCLALMTQDLGRLAAGGEDLRQLLLRKESRELLLQGRVHLRYGVVPQILRVVGPAGALPRSALAQLIAERGQPGEVAIDHSRDLSASSRKSRLMVPQAGLPLMMSPHICRASQVRLHLCRFLKPTMNAVTVPRNATTVQGMPSHFMFPAW